jgi:glc operon protein GlcG
MSLFRISLVLVGLIAASAPAAAQEKKPPLVTRDRVQLNLAGAEAVLEAAKKKAAALGLKCNIAVVDDGGHLLAFARMDGARPASAATALTKAVSAATFRQETGPLPAKGEPDVLLSLSIQTASGGKITTLKGGVPIVIDGQVVGAVGVGGGTGDQDAEGLRATSRTKNGPAIWGRCAHSHRLLLAIAPLQVF